MDYNFKRLNNKDLVIGKVVDVRKDEIELDVDSFAPGILKKEEFISADVDLRQLVKKGDKLECVVINVVNGDEQVINLTRKPLIKKENLNKIKELYENGEIFTVSNLKEIKGGYITSYLDYSLFMPQSQYVEGYNDVKIIEFDDVKKKFIISSKVITKQIAEENKNKEYDLIKVGEIMHGKVVRLEPYGAFVRFDYNQALIRISQITYEHITLPNEALSLGEEIAVKIIKKDNGRIEASRKALLKSPFEIYTESHKKGDIIKGKAIQKLSFGILVELEKNVTGLLHESEYAWNPKSNFKDYIKLGDELELMIINIDPKNEKIGLSKKAIEDNPWKRVEAKKGDIVECIVTDIIPGKGVNVTTLGIDAFVAANELSSEKISKIEDSFNVSDTFKAIVVDIDTQKWYINLSVKKYEEMLEKQEFEKYMNNQDNEEKVTLKDLFKDVLK